MGEYDRVLKENIELIFLPLLEKLLGLSIKNSIEIKDKVHSTIEREPDFLKRIIDTDDQEFILQLEFQTSDDPEMVYRMAEYKAIIQRKYQLPVKQFVIYLGSSTPMMRTKLNHGEQITGFQLTNINDVSTASTLESEIPEEIILSILTEYSAADTKNVIDQIINKLQRATKDETELRRTIQQLLILSRLRNLDEEIEKKISKMPITYDIKTDRLFNKGIEQGIEQSRHSVVKKALLNKKLTLKEIAELADVSIDYVISVQSEMNK